MPEEKKASSPTKSRSESLKATILEAACRLFMERGVGGTTMQDIADELGISRPTIYYHYENKEAVLKEIAERVTVKAAAISGPRPKSDRRHASEALHDVIVQYTELMMEHALEFQILDREEALLDTLIPGHAVEKRRVLDNFAGIIRTGMERGEFKAVDPYITALGIIGMCNWTSRWYRSDRRMSARDIAETYANHSLAALERPAAREVEPTIGDAIRILREDVDYLETLAARAGDQDTSER